jgi:L-threonylcarbamoyladenylate synthase
MMKSPERVPLHSLLSTPASAHLRKIASAVDKGALFVYPTETIYGIGGSVTAPGMRERICLAKKRANDVPLIIIAPDRNFFRPLSLTFPPAAEKLARRFWPGMLTLVLPSPDHPDGIAVRVTDHPFITALFRYCTSPIYSTSANMSGKPYVNDPDAIFDQFANAINFMIDAGPLPSSLPSTVVRVGEDDTVTVLREGVIPGKKIVIR